MGEKVSQCVRTKPVENISKFQKLLRKLSSFGVFSAIRRSKVSNGFSLLDKNEEQCDF